MDHGRARLGPAGPGLRARSILRHGPGPAHRAALAVPTRRDALDTAIGAFLTARAAEDSGTEGRLRAIAVDGKVLRGSRAGGKSAVTLLAAMDHNGSVLAQRQVADKSNEIPAFAPLLDTLDLNYTVITADALHTQHDRGRYLRRHGAHYLAVVKANHPGLFRPGQEASLAGHHARPQNPRPSPSPPGDTPVEDRRLRPHQLPRRGPGPPDRALAP
ncbi:ISAs1 family transposase [Streptomyces sp. NPDC006733]|uniref:ISAs1 family transposase n=1 Tax=Streptomyces sp. NPDC006733 TaxID=3155460 RepID=UPI0033D8CC0C